MKFKNLTLEDANITIYCESELLCKDNTCSNIRICEYENKLKIIIPEDEKIIILEDYNMRVGESITIQNDDYLIIII